MGIESRLQALEDKLFRQEQQVFGVEFTPADDRPEPPSDPRALRAFMESVAMDATIPAAPPE